MIASIVVSLVTAAAAAAFLQRWARRAGIARKIGVPTGAPSRNLPPVGGLAFAAGLAGGFICWHVTTGVAWSAPTAALAVAGLVLLVAGLVDDFVRELAPWQKLMAQLAAWLCLLQGGFFTEMAFLPTWANLLVSLAWTLLLVNALNLLDIIDGLAVGIALIASGTFWLLAGLTGQADTAGWLGIVCGGLLGVLPFNFPRARLFLGDSGSQLVGLLLASMSIGLSYAPLGREIALATPLLVLALPLYDLAFVALMRMRSGRSPIRKSPDHFVLRLVRQGRSPSSAVVAMFGLCGAFSACAVIVNFAPNLIGTLTVGVVLLAALVWAARMAQVRMDA